MKHLILTFLCQKQFKNMLYLSQTVAALMYNASMQNI